MNPETAQRVVARGDAAKRLIESREIQELYKQLHEASVQHMLQANDPTQAWERLVEVRGLTAVWTQFKAAVAHGQVVAEANVAEQTQVRHAAEEERRVRQWQLDAHEARERERERQQADRDQRWTMVFEGE